MRRPSDFSGSKRRRVWLAIFAAAVWSASCGAGAGRGTAMADGLAIKPPITGLISMGNSGFDPATNNNAGFGGIPGNDIDDLTAKQNAFDGIVINIPWKQLQLSAGGGLNDLPIDQALQQIKAYNADPGTTVPLRAVLRIWAGVNAPDWVKTLDGPPTIVALPGRGGVNGAQKIGRFWSNDYVTAWRALQASLAARYDSEPLIAEVSNTSCTSADDEWTALTWPGSRLMGISSIANLHAAGFNDAAFKACLLSSWQDYAGWKTTPIQLILGAFRPTDDMQEFGIPKKDNQFARQLISIWKARLGARAILANHEINYPPDPSVVQIYRLMKNAGVPLEFQTRSPKKLDWAETVEETVCLGGNALEIWNNTNFGGYKQIPLPTLLDWSRQLKHTTSNELCPVLSTTYAW